MKKIKERVNLVNPGVHIDLLKSGNKMVKSLSLKNKYK